MVSIKSGSLRLTILGPNVRQGHTSHAKVSVWVQNGHPIRQTSARDLSFLKTVSIIPTWWIMPAENIAFTCEERSGDAIQRWLVDLPGQMGYEEKQKSKDSLGNTKHCNVRYVLLGTKSWTRNHEFSSSWRPRTHFITSCNGATLRSCERLSWLPNCRHLGNRNIMPIFPYFKLWRCAFSPLKLGSIPKFPQSYCVVKQSALEQKHDSGAPLSQQSRYSVHGFINCHIRSTHYRMAPTDRRSTYVTSINGRTVQ